MIIWVCPILDQVPFVSLSTNDNVMLCTFLYNLHFYKTAKPNVNLTNKCRYFKQALWIYPIFGKYEFYEMCDNNDVKFKGTCLNNIPSCYWKLHNLRMKLWVKVSSKASQELDNNNELVCTSAPGWVFKQSCAIKPCRFDHCGNAGKL